MKIIKINESQKNRLFEAYQEGFSFKKLSALKGSWEKQYEYCCKWLGEPDGYGSSRCVFTLSDNIILKLAIGEFRDAGIAQNETEFKLYNMTQSPLLARIYDSDDSFTYIVCENVVPLQMIDFEKILGIPFMSYWSQTSKPEKVSHYKDGDTTVGFNDYFDGSKGYVEEYRGITVYDILCYIESNYVTDEPYNDFEIEEIINKIPWFKELEELVEETGMTDFCNDENFGLVNRNGKPSIVILDGGMNLNLWYKHYAK